MSKDSNVKRGQSDLFLSCSNQFCAVEVIKLNLVSDLQQNRFLSFEH